MLIKVVYTYVYMSTVKKLQLRETDNFFLRNIPVMYLVATGNSRPFY